MSLSWRLKTCLASLFLLLSSCASLQIEPIDLQAPVSLTEQIYGYEQVRKVGHFRREVWVYHVLGMPQWSLGTRQGSHPQQLLKTILNEELQPNQGVVRLKIQHMRNGFTWFTSLISLGVVTPTVLIVEGDRIEVQPLQERR